MTPQLKQFLQEWYDWATQPKVEDTFHFMRNQGLCASLTSWCKGDVDLQLELYEILSAEFKGNYQFPFEQKLPTYWEAKMRNALHKNPKRLAWVKSKL